MNETTVNKLKNNPFYSPTKSQYDEMNCVETGELNIHQSKQELDINPTGMVKRKSRRRKKRIEQDEE